MLSITHQLPPRNGQPVIHDTANVHRANHLAWSTVLGMRMCGVIMPVCGEASLYVAYRGTSLVPSVGSLDSFRWMFSAIRLHTLTRWFLDAEIGAFLFVRQRTVWISRKKVEFVSWQHSPWNNECEC
jgi:hypothetical protein